MNHARIQILIDHLRTPRLDQPKFDMAEWFADPQGEHLAYVENLPEENFCGTAACIAGTAVWIFRDEIEDKHLSISEAAEQLLGLSPEQSYGLFMGHFRPAGMTFLQIDPNTAADELERMLAA